MIGLGLNRRLKLKIALIKPPQTYANWYKRPMLGISYICSFLEQNGYECRIFDSIFSSLTDSQLLEQVLRYKPDVVGFTAMSFEVGNAARIATAIKERMNIPTILGGCHITALPQKTLQEFPVFDYGVFGEGEFTTLELIEYIHGKRQDIKSIKGIVYRSADNKVYVNEPRPPLTEEELNNLPLPAFYQYYGNDRAALTGKNAYYVMFSARGCPYSCVFCMTVLGKKVRRRSADNILAELDHAISAYGVHSIDFADEIFLFDNHLTRELLTLMIERGYSRKLRWSGLTHANMVNEELIHLAKKAGCYRLEMGVESGDDEILKKIGKKGVSVKKIKESVKIVKDAGIKMGTYYIIGHPGETRETLRKTIDLAVELNTDTIAVGIMSPYPGTKVYEMALRGEEGYKLLSTDWSDYDKYGGKALELRDIPYKELERLQMRAIFYLYLKNFRFIDLLQYLWVRRGAIFYFLCRKAGLKNPE